jgi:hypothetical protein
VVEEGGRRVNTVQKLCIHYANAKMIPLEAILGVGGEDNTVESGGGVELKYDIFNTL